MTVKNSIETQPNTNTGKGRVKGSKNLLTKELKGIMANIVAGELGRVPEALDRVNKTKPEKYVALVIRLAEVCLPKTQEVELNSGSEGVDIRATLEDMRNKLLNKDNE